MVRNFYSHAREGRDMLAIMTLVVFYNFYSHAREGRDETIVYGAFTGLAFLLTRPRGA